MASRNNVKIKKFIWTKLNNTSHVINLSTGMFGLFERSRLVSHPQSVIRYLPEHLYKETRHAKGLWGIQQCYGSSQVHYYLIAKSILFGQIQFCIYWIHRIKKEHLRMALFKSLIPHDQVKVTFIKKVITKSCMSWGTMCGKTITKTIRSLVIIHTTQ